MTQFNKKNKKQKHEFRVIKEKKIYKIVSMFVGGGGEGSITQFDLCIFQFLSSSFVLEPPPFIF